MTSRCHLDSIIRCDFHVSDVSLQGGYGYLNLSSPGLKFGEDLQMAEGTTDQTPVNEGNGSTDEGFGAAVGRRTPSRTG